MRRTCVLLAMLAGMTVPAAGTPAPAPATAYLDRYLNGEFDAVAHDLKALAAYDDLLDELRLGGAAWVDAVPADRPRRRLAAATFALEAARAADHVDWKWTQRFKRENDKPQDADDIRWKAPPLLIEWGCALMRAEPGPRAIERIWHLAANAVAQRAGDPEFLIGSPIDARMNAADEINHVYHAGERFKTEPRFKLAVAIALEWLTWGPNREHVPAQPAAMATAAFEGLIKDPAVGGEASMRLGALHARRNNNEDALELFARAETLTRDRYVIYLARYFKGQAHERAKLRVEAEAAYRGALAVIPQAQSATLALAALLAKEGRRAEAGALVEAQLGTSPQPADPWIGYGAADDRFWPELIARLRAEIRR